MRPLAALFLFALPLVAQDGRQPPPPLSPLLPKPADPTKFDIMDWTPRPAIGQAEPWEKKHDPEWDDARFQKTDTGPAFDATFTYPHGRVSQFVFKGVAVKLGAKGDACALFDRCTMRWAAGWTGGYLQHSAKRFGLLNTPAPPQGSAMVFSTAPAAGWTDADGKYPAITKPTAPLPADHARFHGYYLSGDRVVMSYTVQGVGVLDSMRTETANGKTLFVRTLRIEPTDKKLAVRLDDARQVELPPSKEVREYAYAYGGDGTEKPEADDLAKLIKPGKARWGKPLDLNMGKSEESGPFVIENITIPYENRYNALFFCTGLDFLPGGGVAVCTCHGDVWVVTVGGDKADVNCSWQRFATGLYHPLGLKVIDGKIHVLERGQLTRLHDSNDDGEADFYECVSNDWHTGPGEHSYDTCLETDPKGNFYFFKTGDTDLPSGGTLLKVSADGKKVETFATGFRHPIGMGMSPTGIVTGADQEGNYMPATRIDEYKEGGFYGDLRAHHRKEQPKTYDSPLCWLPREVDNSAGGQVWVPPAKPKKPDPKPSEGPIPLPLNMDGGWQQSPLAGLPLHLSYGRCRAFVLLRQEVDKDTVQGGAVALPLTFLSGSCRGRFDPQGYLWVCGLTGWQTAAKADGSLQRVRYTGKPLDTVVKSEVTAKGVRLTFTRPLDKATAEDVKNYKAAAWNYRWSADYGSKRWKPSAPTVEGQDEFAFTEAKLEDDKTVFLKAPAALTPVMQLQVGYNLKAKEDAAKLSGSVFLTVNKAKEEK